MLLVSQREDLREDLFLHADVRHFSEDFYLGNMHTTQILDKRIKESQKFALNASLNIISALRKQMFLDILRYCDD